MISYKPREGRGPELEASSLAVWFNKAGRAGLHLGLLVYFFLSVVRDIMNTLSVFHFF